MASHYGNMTSTQIKAWKARLAAHPHAALAAAAAHHAAITGHPSPALTPAQRADANPLYNPLAALSGSDLQTAVNTMVSGQTKPQLDSLNQEQTADNKTAKQLSDRAAGFSQFVNNAGQQGLDAQKQIAADLASRLGTAGTTAQSTLDANGAAANAGLANAGAGDALSQVTAALAAQKLNAGANSAAASGAGANQGYNFESLANNLKSADALQGGENQKAIAGQLQNQITDLTGKRKAVTDTIPGLKSDALVKLRDQAFQDYAVAQGLKIKDYLATVTGHHTVAADQTAAKNADTSAKNADTSATNATTSQTNATTAQNSLAERITHDRNSEKIAANNSAIALLRAQNAGKPGSLTPTQKRAIVLANGKIRDRVDAALTDALHQGGTDKNGNPLPPLKGGALVAELQARYKGPFANLVATAAVERAEQPGGYLTNKTIKALHDAGIGVPTAWVNTAAQHPRT